MLMRGLGRQQTDHEPALYLCSKQGKQYPGLFLKEQPVEQGRWLSPLLIKYWTTYRILHPFCCLQSLASPPLINNNKKKLLIHWSVGHHSSLRNQDLVSLEKKWLQRHLSATPSARGKVIEGTESGSSQRCMVGGHKQQKQIYLLRMTKKNLSSLWK